jgi:hypothetical protein
MATTTTSRSVRSSRYVDTTDILLDLEYDVDGV